DQPDYRGRGGRTQENRIGRHPRHELAGRSARDLADPGGQVARHHAGTRPQDDALGERAEQDPLPEGDRRPHDQERRERQDRTGKRGVVGQRVKHPLGHHGTRETGRRANQCQEQTERQRGKVWSPERPEDLESAWLNVHSALQGEACESMETHNRTTVYHYWFSTYHVGPSLYTIGHGTG